MYPTLSSTGASSTATAKAEQTEWPPQRRNNWRSTATTPSAPSPLPQAKWVSPPPPPLSLFPTQSRWTSVRLPPCPTQQQPGTRQFPQHKTKTWQQTRTLEQTREVCGGGVRMRCGVAPRNKWGATWERQHACTQVTDGGKVTRRNDGGGGGGVVTHSSQSRYTPTRLAAS